MQIILSVNNNAETMEIPIIPTEFKVDKGQKSETFETSSGTEFALISPSGVVSVTWSSFFPCRDYPYLHGTRLSNASEYIFKIDTWQQQKLPVRLAMIDNGKSILNVPTRCVIENYSMDTSGDYNYSIRFDKIPSSLIEEELTMAQYEELKSLTEDIYAKIEPLLKRYNSVNEEGFPEFAKDTVNKLLSANYLQGNDDSGNLDLSYDMLRIITVLDRAQAFRDCDIYNFNDGNMPKWAQPAVKWLLDNGCLTGDENGWLDLTPDILRGFTVMFNAMVKLGLINA